LTQRISPGTIETMGSRQIRVGQLIAPFGPGSIYTDRRGIPQVVCGLDHWFMKVDPVYGLVSCDKPAEFDRFEPRLSALLHVDRFRTPPDYRFYKGSGDGEAPPNAMLHIPALRFPRWYRHTKTGELRRFNLHSAKIDPPAGGGRWQPVRFISVCSAGHLNEFPWQEWLECACGSNAHLVLTDRGGSELSSIRIECTSCPPGSTGRKGKSLSGTTVRPDSEQGEKSAFQMQGIACPGERPWLGEGADDRNCNEALVGALINQTNLYFPKTISAIALPDLEIQEPAVVNAKTRIEEEPEYLGIVKTLWKLGDRTGCVGMISAKLAVRGLVFDNTVLETALEAIFDKNNGSFDAHAAEIAEPEQQLLSFRRAEFNILRTKIDDPANVPHLRVVPTHVASELAPWFEKVQLVEKLRETRVFYGFDRLQQSASPLSDMPARALTQLFRNPPTNPAEQWLPAVEVFGEGIFIELSEKAVQDWRSKNSGWLNARITPAFIRRIVAVSQTIPPLGVATRDWASRYLLVHSLAHILINQVVFECGYSTASLRERLYVSQDPTAPMAAFMIYTAAGDSEGTLGGLVRLGHSDRLTDVVRRAASRASWCSADPICSENLGGQGSKLANMAACHACVLLPETSCETINEALDRALVVGTPTDPDAGFLSELVLAAMSYAE
jgi:hypothetical protein